MDSQTAITEEILENASASLPSFAGSEMLTVQVRTANWWQSWGKNPGFLISSTGLLGSNHISAWLYRLIKDTILHIFLLII